MSQDRRLHARVHGIVQGVGFRHFVWKQAQGLGLTGWVRNCYDGTVEVVAEGPEPALQALLERLRQGPPAARVERVDVRWEPPTHEFLTFDIAPTAPCP